MSYSALFCFLKIIREAYIVFTDGVGSVFLWQLQFALHIAEALKKKQKKNLSKVRLSSYGAFFQIALTHGDSSANFV